MEAVARAAGVSKSTIYRHWPSREVLVLEAFTHKTVDAAPVPHSGDVAADLRAYLAHLAYCLDFGGAATTIAGLILDAGEDAEFASLFRDVLLRERRDGFRTLLTRGQRRGEVRRDLDVEVAVDAVYGAVHHRLLVSGQPIDGSFVTALVDVTLRGIGDPETPRQD